MKRLILLFITLISLSTAIAKPNPNFSSTLNSIRPAMMEATPEVVKARLEAIPTSIELRYTSDVQTYVDTYIKKDFGRRELAKLLERCEYYFPIFEEALKAAGLPDELKYIPIIESRLKDEATSNKGAGGLWQIMPSVARGYDMQVTSTIDERRDPYIASERACTMLKKAYEKFGNWSLALASYNCGSGTVSKALKRAGGDPKSHTFWTIAPYLPAQTRKYVPKFIAMTYVMTYHKDHNIHIDANAPILATDTVRVSSKHSLKAIAKSAGVDVAEIKSLNPHYRSDVVPATTSRPCTVILPASNAREYKLKLGRTIEESANTAGASAPEANKEKEMASATAIPVSTRADLILDEYEDVPSTTTPNTVIRRKRASKKKSLYGAAGA